MKMNLNQYLAVLYADLFDFPLTFAEARLWQINMEHSLSYNKKDIPYNKPYYCFRRSLINLRPQREKYSLEKSTIAAKVASRLAKLPLIQSIFLIGSVAVGNADKNADIDLMIVSSPGTLWITRFLVVVYLTMIGEYRRRGLEKDRVCPNIFLDANHLEIKDQNLYTAHEILQAECLFDRGEVEKKWLEENQWVKKFLSNAYFSKNNQKTNHPTPISNKYQFPNSEFQKRFSWIFNIGHWSLDIGDWCIGFLIFLEPLAFLLQYLYQLPKQTNERVGWGYAFFHPVDLSTKILSKFNQKLVKSGLNGYHF